MTAPTVFVGIDVAQATLPAPRLGPREPSRHHAGG